MATVQLDIDHQRVERQKQMLRDLWAYRPVDHIPIMIWPGWSFGHSVREKIESAEIQFEVNVRTIEKSLQLIPDDYIPWAQVTLGYMTIATMFGMEPQWGSDPDQPPGTGGHIIDDMAQVHELAPPGPDAGLLPENVRRLRYHAERLPDDVYLTGIDAGGPLNSCKDLLETNLLYTAFYDAPEEMHRLLNLVTETQLMVYREVVGAVGGIERMTSIDFDPNWAPEGYKSFVSDDISATISPAIFETFSLPYNNRLFAPWGRGMLHNCGPNPCKKSYMKHTPRLKGLNLAYRYSHEDFPALRGLLAGDSLIHIMMDNEPTPEDMLDAFRHSMETLAPDVAAIPICFVDDTWADEDVTAFYWEMRRIGEAYAANMKWTDER